MQRLRNKTKRPDNYTEVDTSDETSTPKKNNPSPENAALQEIEETMARADKRHLDKIEGAEKNHMEMMNIEKEKLTIGSKKSNFHK